MIRKYLFVFLSAVLLVSGCKKENYKPVIGNLTYKVLNCEPPYNVVVSYVQQASTVNNDEQCHWDFGDGDTTNTLLSATHVYDSAGVYHLTVDVENVFGKATAEMNIDLSASYQVTSSFTSPDSKYAGCNVAFTNSSTFATNYLWDFGDATFSSDVHPTHQYTNAGTYAVKLKSICSGDSVLATKNITITAAPTQFTLFNIELNLASSELDSDLDDADARPDYFFKVYINGAYVTSTNVYDNVPSFPISFYTINHNFVINSSNQKITLQVWEKDLTGTDDYVAEYYFYTGWVKDECYPTIINWPDKLKCTVQY